MNGTDLPRLVAAVFLMVAMAVAIIEIGRNGEESGPARSAEASTENPLQAALQRCQGLGEAAIRDAACLDIWAENRRRFLTPGARPTGQE